MVFVRLNKFLAQCGIASRRHSDEMITLGKVKVNGVVTTELGFKIQPNQDQVIVDGTTLRQIPKGVLLLHKPRDVITTMKDPEGRRTVAEYLGRNYKGYFPAGRLDWDSTGLVVMTNDGMLAEYLTHPRYGMSRVYHVQVEGRVNEATFAKLERGIKLVDGIARATNVAFIRDQDDSTWLSITVKEGRNRLVRRMCDAVGHPVINLKRISHGPFKLGTLPSGQLRRITEAELFVIKKSIFGSKVTVNGNSASSYPKNRKKKERRESKLTADKFFPLS
jgi:23S rRNA pseudouridine2605 synthase